MYILGIDFETTITDPVDPKLARIIEIGACLWDTVKNKPIVMGSVLVWGDEPEYTWSPRIKELTGIEFDYLRFHGMALKDAFTWLLETFVYPTRFIDGCQVLSFIAHNGAIFDKVVFEAEIERKKSSLDPQDIDFLKSIRWVDSMCDVPYPLDMPTRKLSYLAAEHGFLNPFAHRALPDVLTMLRVAGHYDFEETVTRSTLARVEIMADVKKPWEDTAPEGEKGIDFAKLRGFKFKADSKRWTKLIFENEVEAEREICKHKFRVGVIKKE